MIARLHALRVRLPLYIHNYYACIFFRGPSTFKKGFIRKARPCMYIYIYNMHDSIRTACAFL